MRAIFISYRREDAEGQAGRLFDDLVLLFGDQSVFMDVVGIEPGRDFRRAIDAHVASCGVLLAVIGKSWLKIKDGSGRRRLDDPMDFVRLETASALKRDIPVIPVLVGGASMPHAEDLPGDLQELAYRNGVELTHPRWDSDVKLLATSLAPYVEAKPKPIASRPPVAPSRLKPVAIALTLIMIAIFGSLLLLTLVGYLVSRNASEVVTSQAAPIEQPNSGPAVSDEKVEEEKAANQYTNATETPETTQVEKELSFEDWSGLWELSWEFPEGHWLGPIPMELKSDKSGISGDYGLGPIEGVFVNGDFSKAEGKYLNTKTEGELCSSGERGGPFSLTLAKDGSSMEGLWGACGEVATRHWKATRLTSE